MCILEWTLVKLFQSRISKPTEKKFLKSIWKLHWFYWSLNIDKLESSTQVTNSKSLLFSFWHLKCLLKLMRNPLHFHPQNYLIYLLLISLVFKHWVVLHGLNRLATIELENNYIEYSFDEGNGSIVRPESSSGFSDNFCVIYYC